METLFGGHIFDRVCKQHDIQHRLTKPYHPWTKGQAEWMNRAIKEATVKTFHYPNPDRPEAHVLAFASAHNFAKHHKAFRLKTSFEAVCQAWMITPDIFKLNPGRVIPGPNTWTCELWRAVAGRYRTGAPRLLIVSEMLTPGTLAYLA